MLGNFFEYIKSIFYTRKISFSDAIHCQVNIFSYIPEFVLAIITKKIILVTNFNKLILILMLMLSILCVCLLNMFANDGNIYLRMVRIQKLIFWIERND